MFHFYSPQLWAKSEANKAKNYGCTPVVLLVDLCTDISRFLDLDDSAQMQAFGDEMSRFLQSGFHIDFADRNQLRCFCCNYYCQVHKIDLIAYTFSIPNNQQLGFRNINKKQFCVRNDDIISNIRMEVDDYAV